MGRLEPYRQNTSYPSDFSLSAHIFHLLDGTCGSQNSRKRSQMPHCRVKSPLSPQSETTAHIHSNSQNIIATRPPHNYSGTASHPKEIKQIDPNLKNKTDLMTGPKPTHIAWEEKLSFEYVHGHQNFKTMDGEKKCSEANT